VLILLVLVGVALVGGLLAAWAARRWPAVDPTRVVGAAAREGSKHDAAPSFLRARMDPGTATGLGLTLALIGVVVGGAIAPDTNGIDWIASIVAAVLLVLLWRAVSGNRTTISS
jgi:hypothetical protein